MSFGDSGPVSVYVGLLTDSGLHPCCVVVMAHGCEYCPIQDAQTHLTPLTRQSDVNNEQLMKGSGASVHVQGTL